ncbi:MAG TPA: anti-sigma factor [Solirubrobacteraceae bacterium]|nr:anti-sigma factor [Solirubrobacteraceae bacterium]
MSGERTDDRRHCAGDVAAYALGALDAAEAQAFARHLESCPDCRRELDAFAPVVDELARTAPRMPAPPSLRSRVLQAAADEPAPGRDAADHAHAPRGLRRPTWSGTRRPLLALGSAVAIIVAAIVVVAIAVSSGPSTRVIRAQVTGPGTASLRITDGHGELILHRFAAPPPGKIYEVWLQRPNGPPAPTSALFGVTAQGRGSVDVPGSLHGVRRVMVTPEPAGGSRVPTHAPVIVATLH